MQSLPIVQSTLKQFRKLGLRSPDPAGARRDQERAKPHGRDVSVSPDSIEEEAGRRMITKLPGELRNKIYEYLMSNWQDWEIHLTPLGTKKSWGRYLPNPRALSHTCRMFCNEYAPLLKTRFIFPIELAYLGKYLDDFHSVIDASNPLHRRGGSINFMGLDYCYASYVNTRLNLLNLTKTIHASPDLHVSFDQFWEYPYFVDLTGGLLVEALNHNFDIFTT